MAILYLTTPILKRILVKESKELHLSMRNTVAMKVNGLKEHRFVRVAAP
jgi:hypothetical protein